MARCGCAGGSCGCKLSPLSTFVAIDGVGSEVDPFTIRAAATGPRLPNFTTVGRPSASTAGAGAMIWNTTTNLPNFSDGTNWRNAAGAVV